jgi:hypothetical protein
VNWVVLITGLIATCLVLLWVRWQSSRTVPGSQQLTTDCFFWNTDRAERWVSGNFIYNIQLAKQLILSTPREVISINIAHLQDAINEHRIGLNPGYETDPHVDPDFPVIVIPSSGNPMIIDGWHRVAKALYLGLARVNAVFLTEQETEKIREVRKKENAIR